MGLVARAGDKMARGGELPPNVRGGCEEFQAGLHEALGCIKFKVQDAALPNGMPKEGLPSPHTASNLPRQRRLPNPGLAIEEDDAPLGDVWVNEERNGPKGLCDEILP